MDNELITELNKNTRILSYDIMYNHSILSSLDGAWNNFYVQSWGHPNSEEQVQYRQFRANLYGLMDAVLAFLENITMRIYILYDITFNSTNIFDPNNVELTKSKTCGEDNMVSQTICDLITEFWRIKEYFTSINDKFTHFIQSQENPDDLTTFEISFDPMQTESSIKTIPIATTLGQYLESVVRIFHITLDLKEEIERNESHFNILSFAQILPNIKGALKMALQELRYDARQLDQSWDELHVRLKNAAY